MSAAFFTVSIEGGRDVSGEACVGPWSTGLLHGGRRPGCSDGTAN